MLMKLQEKCADDMDANLLFVELVIKHPVLM